MYDFEKRKEIIYIIPDQIAVGEGVKNTGQLLQNAGKVEESVQNIVLSQTGKKDKL